MSLISAEGNAQIQLVQNEPRLQTMTIIKPKFHEGYVHIQNEVITVSTDPSYIIELFYYRLLADAPYCPGLERNWQKVISRSLETNTHLVMASLFTLDPPYEPPWKIFSLGTQPLPILIKSSGYYHTGVFFVEEKGCLTCRITSPLVIGKTPTGDFIFAYRIWNTPRSIPSVAFVGEKLGLFDWEVKILYRHMQSLVSSRIVQLETV